MNTVTDYLEHSACLYPDKIAMVDSKRKITLSDLRNEALHLATNLANNQLFKQPIAIFLDKSIECVSALIGIAYSGNYYSILDTKMPVQRLKNIISTFEPRVIVTNKEHLEQVEPFKPQNCRTILWEEIMDGVIQAEKIIDASKKIVDSDVLYVLFTSGSTGIPKGVVVSHKAVMTYTEWVHDAFHLNDSVVIGNQTPFYFSMSVLDIFQMLRNGCTMYIIPRILFSFPVKLMEFIAQNKINMIYWVPSALCMIANLKALKKRDISCLKRILFAGEVMPTKQLNQWMKSLPSALFANLYGPTEVTDICDYYIIDRKIRDEEPIPIGISCKNTDTFILGQDNKLIETEGEKGELCVRGSTLAYGYLKDPAKTAKVFVQNPLQNGYPEIIYRTGDIVHINNLGELIYDGRKDFQIKHMGHRIELGEIDTLVSSITEIMQNCSIYDVKENMIVLFYSGNIEEAKLKQKLINLVPQYMIPNKFVKMDSLPINANGKINRQFLESYLHNN